MILDDYFSKIHLSDWISAISAGLLIGMADIIYLNCTDKIVGAFLFPLALLSIMHFKFHLYTGKIGRVYYDYNIPFMLMVLIGNTIGLFFYTMFYNPTYMAFFINKLTFPWYIVIQKGFLCGMLMYLAVTCKSDLVLMLAVAGFILSGGEHCIADIGYMFLSRNLSMESLKFIGLVTLGNSLGSIVLHNLQLRTYPRLG